MNYPLPNYGYNSVYKYFTGVVIEQTRVCPNNCVFCSFAKAGHEHVTMSLDDLRYVLDSLPNFNGDVTFSSGDVLTLKDLPERIALLKKHWPNCHLNLTTSFNIPHDRDYIKNLFLAGMDSMIISCYGHTPEDYAKIHGVKRFSELERNIAILGSLPKDMTSKVTLRYFRDTQHLFNIDAPSKKLEKFLDTASKMGINKTDSRHCFPWTPPKPVDGHALWELPYPCDIVWGNMARTLTVLYNLDVVPCCMMRDENVLGNLREMSLEEIFTGEKYTAFYQAWWEMRPGDIPVCNTCQRYLLDGEREELLRMAAWQARELRGQKVIFWGGGEAYRACKSFFVDCEPVAMLMATPADSGQKYIDGIPVHHPDAFLPTLTEPLPLVIFAMQENSPKILQTLKEKYAFYKPSKLVICPANARIVPSMEAFFQD